MRSSCPPLPSTKSGHLQALHTYAITYCNKSCRLRTARLRARLPGTSAVRRRGPQVRFDDDAEQIVRILLDDQDDDHTPPTTSDRRRLPHTRHTNKMTTLQSRSSENFFAHGSSTLCVIKRRRVLGGCYPSCPPLRYVARGGQLPRNCYAPTTMAGNDTTHNSRRIIALPPMEDHLQQIVTATS